MKNYSVTAWLLGMCIAATSYGCSGSDNTTTPNTTPGADTGVGPITVTPDSGGVAVSDTSTTPAPAGTVEIFSWWVAPGEAEALQALMDLNKKNYSTVSVLNAAALDKPNSRTILANRLAAGNPPDLFQANAGDLLAFLAANPGSLAPLDDTFTSLGLTGKVVPEVIKEVTVAGKIYAMPVNVHRAHTLYINKAIFAANHLDPATAVDTMEHFLATCATLKAAGVMPLATGYQGWIQRMMFNEIALGVMGPDAFMAYFGDRVAADSAAAPAPATLATAVDTYELILNQYTNKPAILDGGVDSSFGWTNAADLVHSGQAAMYMHGNWVTAYIQQLGWTPGVDFDAVTSPGSQGLFAYDLDTFAMPLKAPHPDITLGFLTTIASEEGQLQFAHLKGSSPIRLDIDPAKFGTDSVGRTTYANLVSATKRRLMPGLAAWDTAFGNFMNDHDKAALLKAFADNPPLH